MPDDALNPMAHDTAFAERVQGQLVDAEIARLRTEIERLCAELLDARKLSHEWMKKHDKLLGFIQARPAVLKELIELRSKPETP